VTSASRTSSASSATVPGIGLRIYRCLQWLIIIGVMGGMVWGWQFLKDPAKFPVKAVKVEASYQHVSRETLQRAVMPYVEERSFFDIDVNGLKHSLLQIPWVADVKVQRIWPKTLVIRVKEQHPVAQFGNKMLINAQGQLFSPPNDTFPANLPVLRGKEDKAAKLWQYYHEISAILAPLRLSIRELDLNDRQSFDLVLNNGTKLFLGHHQVLFRLQRFVKVYPQIFTSPSVQAESVDLRYENGLTIKWRQSQAVVIKK